MTTYFLCILFSFAVILLCNPCVSLSLFACQNASCGTIFTHISYPFGLSNSGCGHPAFQIDCISDIPHLTINGVNYTVLDYSHGKITVVNDGVYADQICGLPDASVNLSASPFMLSSSDYQNLTFVQGCPSKNSSVIPLPCNVSWLFSLGEIPPCLFAIQVPVPKIPVGSLAFELNIVQVLQQGFKLEWNESDEMFRKCAGCKAKKGICGFDASELFTCNLTESLNSPARGSSPGSPSYAAAGPISRPPAPEELNTPVAAMSGAAHSVKSYTGIIIGLGVGSTLLISGACIGIFLCYKKDLSPNRELENSELGASPKKKGSRLVFSYLELELATRNFNADRELGDGGFSSVYLGKLWDGRLVAVKKLFHNNSQRVQQFFNEVEILSSLDHPNLVQLIGYCQYGRELLLVYEYASNGTLADHLHGENKAAKVLVWKTRLDIALETAQALAYLHFSIKPPILHRDVKSSNILLDQNFRAKVADFGLSRLVPLEASHVSTTLQGTPGYVNPDYNNCYRLTNKSDVYSFGVVLAELFSAKKAVDITRDNRDIGLANLVVSKIQCGALLEIVDPSLEIGIKPVVKEMVCRVAELAFRCLAPEKDDRPNMREVVAQLEVIKQFGYGGSTENYLTSYNSFDGVQETRKLQSHVCTGLPTSAQKKLRSISTAPDIRENRVV